jgi:hypothetical protein
MGMSELYFSPDNSKIDAVSFSLPSGYTCPQARACKSQADKNTGKIKDGKHCQFRCFTATSENRFPLVRARAWQNFDALKTVGVKNVSGMADLIDSELPEGPLVRIHVGGDFFNPYYFAAWCEIARRRPGRIEWEGGKPFVVGTIFYAYTKNLELMLNDSIPANLKLTASRGGTMDHLIDEHGLKEARVVFTKAEAEELGYVIDHDDKCAWSQDNSFALLLHGTQPAKSVASKALQILKKEGWTGYNPKNKGKH